MTMQQYQETTTTTSSPSPCMDTSNTRVQTIMFVRHGVARHNVVDKNGAAPDLRDPSLFDPPLILQGKQQALQAGELIKHWWKLQNQSIELVITLPLTRCLQTATIMFMPGEYGETPKLVCLECVREAFGQHYPDKRRSKSLLQKHWPQVIWNDYNTSDEDVYWSPSYRETRHDVLRRIQDFFCYIVQQPQDNIVVVSHGVWIECCLQYYCPTALGPTERVHNCDLFVAQVVSNNGTFASLQHAGRAYPNKPIT